MQRKMMALSIALIMISSSVMAQGFNMIGAGARARGMGGAFIGVADDATAVSWNPAGLVRLETMEASVVGLYESYSPDSDIPDFDPEPFKSSHFNLNFLSGAFPLSIGQRNVVAAVAFQQMIDLYSYYEDDYKKEEQTGGVNAITPAIGVQLSPIISVGAALNIFTGKADYSYSYNDEYGSSESSESEMTYSGTNANIGVMFDLNRARVGVVYKTPFGLTIESDTTEVMLHFPSMVGFGVGFSATEKLTIAFDYEMRKYSESEWEVNGETREADFEDVNQIRLGAEYLIMSGNSILPIRFGFATTPSLNTDSNDDQIVGGQLTAGIGIIMGGINLDLGVEFNSYSYEINTTGSTTYNYSDNYFRFIIAGVFHFSK